MRPLRQETLTCINACLYLAVTRESTSPHKCEKLNVLMLRFSHSFHHHFCFSLHFSLFLVFSAHLSISYPPSVPSFFCPLSFDQQHDSDHVCAAGSSPPLVLQPDRPPSAVEYFLLSLTHLSCSSSSLSLCFLFISF